MECRSDAADVSQRQTILIAQSALPPICTGSAPRSRLDQSIEADQMSPMTPQDVLPDLLRPGLDLVVCGTAPGKRSADAGVYYADRSNRFWKTLVTIGLTPRLLADQEYRSLLEFGIGLTDLAKRASGQDHDLQESDYDIAGFRRKIEKVQPRVLLFNGKTAASKYFGVPIRRLQYGVSEQRISETLVYVATATSGANGHWQLKPWQDCARFVLNASGGQALLRR